ncbi:nickel-dependent hydrogenase large subunit [Pseudomonas japonica]|uniref:Nickel-dependent hydrogenase n=1 Tax=Pseudomonas japonica TaxID=256466 RepID=A0A239C225_9PSED|nr:nickel-dependent hydrogenase large subunit [Pseudomonas japonica]SNS13728.1 Nickel-dependent hydrogenase [Pseudomonas japonica]
MNLAHLAGSLRVRPGQRPALVGGRTPLAGRLLRGQPPEAAAQRLPLLYSLCGRAHRIAAELAVRAALHGGAEPDAAARQALREENRREHLRLFLLDWPRLLSETPASPPGLDMPLDAWFEGSARDWLRHWQADPRQALVDWSGRGRHALARLLHECREQAEALPMPVQALPVDRRTLLDIGLRLGAEEHFVLAPHVHGEPRETGAWSRLRDAAPVRYDSAWLRLGARLADFVALSQPEAAALACGALSLGAGQAIAWCETARGLLLHRVRLEGETIHDYQVLAPTEWNLHPRGTLARALEALPLDGTAARRAALLLAVFDPCLACELDTTAIAPGAPCHA